MSKKKKKNEIEFEVGLDGNITKYNQSQPKKKNDIEFKVDLDGNIHKYNISNIQPKIKQTNSVKEEKPNVIDNAKYVAKKAFSGTLGGLTNIVNSGLQEVENDLKNGSKINNKSDVLKKASIGFLETLVPTLGTIRSQRETTKNIKEIIGDKSKNNYQKIIESGLETLTGAANSERKGLKDSIVAYGAVDKDAHDKVNKVKKKINSPSKKMKESLNKDSEKYGNATNFIGNTFETIGNMVPSMAASAVTKNPNLSLAIMAANSKGQSTEEALKNGASLDEAIKIGNAKSALEVGTEKLTGGLNLFGKGTLDDVVENNINKNIKNKALNYLSKQGVGILGEIGEETLSDIGGTLIDKGTVNPDEKYTLNDFKNTAAQTALSTFLINGMSGNYSRRAYQENSQQLEESAKQENNEKNIIEDLNNSDQQFKGNPLLNDNIVSTMPSSVQQNNEFNNNGKSLSEIEINSTVDSPQNMPSSVQKLETNANIQEITNSPQNSVLYNENLSNQNEQPYQYIKSTNQKVDNLRQSATQYFNNSNEIRDFVGVVEKVIKDKDYNIVFDNTLSSDPNKMVNAQIRTLENGETEIRLNPNSSRSGEFLLTHEITHAIENQDMVNLVMDYASKNKEFNAALESLKATYGTNDVSSEVLADISGQLFGNQDFINNLSMKKPNIFKKIYNTIISLANKITGNSRESLFIRDLKNKWEKAYRIQSNKLDNTKFMVTGIKGTKNLEKIVRTTKLSENYKDALNMYKEGKSKKEIRENTGWYKDVNGDWKFEISDKSAKMKIKPKANSTYDLSELMDHKYIYDMYKDLGKTKVIFEDMSAKEQRLTNEHNKNISVYGYVNKVTGTLHLNNVYVNNESKILETLLHEVQHKIQSKEGFQSGTYVGKDKLEYDNSLGELEARETWDRKDMTIDERIANPSFTSTYDGTNSNEKIYTKNDNKWYTIFGGNIGEIVEENKRLSDKTIRKTVHNVLEEDISKDNQLHQMTGKSDVVEVNKELDSSSFSFDENAKQFDDLKNTNEIEFFKKDNGDTFIRLLDNKSNMLNEFSSFSDKDLIKQLGQNIGKYISENVTNKNKKISISNNDKIYSSNTDYFMNHRPSEDYGNASNFESNMAEVFEHPEWYMDMTELYNRESLSALRKVRNNPDAEIKVYRATPGDSINPGDWVTLSKKYAEEHNLRQMDGKGNVIEMTAKAKDVLFAGDDINEFGYFPETAKYSKEDGTWQAFVENNFKSRGKTTDLSKVLKEQNDGGKNNSNVSKTTLKKGLKGKLKSLSKVIQYEDYTHQESFKNIVSSYNKKTSLETIKEDLGKHFVKSKKEYSKDIIDHIRYEIAKNDIKVTDDLKKKFTNYAIFKKNNLDLMKLKDEGSDIIDIYNNLSKKYPSVFQNENVKYLDEIKLDDIRAKMLNRISSFLHEDIEAQSKYNLEFDAIDAVANFIYDSIQDGNDADSLIQSFDMSPKQIRKEKTAEYREFSSKFIENSGNWKDKKLGLSYKLNTMERNLYDTMGKKDGKRLFENFILPIFEHNKAMQEDITRYNNRIKKFKLSNKESQAVQMLGELKYNPDTLVTQMQVEEIISKNKLDFDKISNAVEEFRIIYDEVFERLNKVLKEQGFKEIEYRKGYFPHFTVEKANTFFGKTLEKLGGKIKSNEIPTDIAGLTENFKPGKSWTSFSQRRLGKVTDYDALQGFDNYIRGAMENIYFTEDILKLRALENEIRYEHSDRGIKTRVDEIQSNQDLTFDEKQEKIDKIYQQYFTPLNNLVTEIRDYTNGLANKKSGLDRTMEQLTNREVYSVMQNISQRLSANMVGMNFGSAITNFIPITQAASQIKGKYLVRAMKDSIKNQYSADGFETKSVFLTTRLNAADRLYKTSWDKASEKANFMFDCIDSVTSNVIVRGKYLENIESKKMNEFEAMRDADNFARKLMAGRSKGEMPTAFNSKNPLIKILTAFQLEVNNQYQYMFKDLPRDMEDESKKKLIGAFIKMFVGAFLYNQLTDKLVGRKSAFSPGDIIKEIYDTATNENLTVKEKSADILENLSQDIPFVGGLIGGGRLPISSVANPLKVLKGESTAFDELKKLGYYTIMPFGGGQLKKTIEGAIMYLNNKEIKGSYNKKGELRFEAERDPLSITKNILFGQYSGKNAQEYFNNHYMPISKKTMERLKKENISVSQYREYENNYNSIKNEKGKRLSEIKATKNEEGKPISGSASAKKAYLIMNSNFSKKAKNYMLSKISNFNNPVDVKTLKKLENNKKSYKLYYSMNKDNREKFINELDEYNISVNKLTDYYYKRSQINKDYVSEIAKEKLLDYINVSNIDDDTKWYLYSKDYGSDNLDIQRSTFNIKFSDYFNVIKYKNSVDNMYPGKESSKNRKRAVFNYINNLNVSAAQKIILFKQAGYSDSSHKTYMFQYINGLPISGAEKNTIWKSIY